MNKFLGVLRSIPLCCAVAILATATISAQAAPPGHGGHGAFGFGHHFDHFNDGFQHNGNGFFGFGGGWGLPWGNEIPAYADAVPYFALHPPVYYSYPVARPYGDSPYPAQPSSFPPTPVDSEPKIIINPYVTPEGAAPSNAAPQNSTPQNSTPVPPAPANSAPSGTPKSVKPTAARIASLNGDSESASPSSGSGMKVILNPFVN